MASHDDTNLSFLQRQLEPLPPVEWTSINQVAPTPIPIGARQPNDPLPAADVVIVTWTSAEWSALDQVFLGRQAPRRADDVEWRKLWHLYTRGASGYSADPQSGELWGYFQLVRIVDQSHRPWRVLLFKSNAHLAHPPWIDGLSAMLRFILQETGPDRIYSIGTAGGARLDQNLGDAIVTNAALLSLQRPQNTADMANGKMFRCPTWFPASTLSEKVQTALLFPMRKIVNAASLEDLFKQLAEKHAGDANFSGISLDDLVNDPIRPGRLGTPRMLMMEDIPLLTTDFYYIADGSGSNAYSFLEMDDAVIAREAQRAGVRYAFVRNVSDPVVADRTRSGKMISDPIRADWSAEIYEHCGFQTSYNGALATWATIAGEGAALYNPPRTKGEFTSVDPLEVKLVYQVRSCGSCSFFWPGDKFKQSYGPYTSYDFDVNAPYAAAPRSGSASSPWILGRTRPPAFPEAEVVDGCRKAPIMTIGINPNLTAFAPGQTGAAWCYPSFYSDDDTDAWAKYAWYYRYRSVYQERLGLDFVRRFILPEGRLYAARAGAVTSALRTDDNPAWEFTIRYEGDSEDTIVRLPGQVGDFPYVLLIDAFPPNNAFAAGDVIAGRLAVPGGIRVEVEQQGQGYYLQFVPVLDRFQETLRKAGHAANLRIGEDVCQLDMVACASPHWNPKFLGGSQGSIDAIVSNCVSENAWAMKQFVQTKPAVLYVVSESSWKMFHGAFGAFVQRNPPLSVNPADHDFTLLRETTDPDHPCIFRVNLNIDGTNYECITRVVITPHFSYNDNFLPQYRFSQPDWQNISQAEAACAFALRPQNGFTVVAGDPEYPNDYVVIRLSADADKAAEARAWLQQQFPEAYQQMERYYYDPHSLMAGVLDELLQQGTLRWQDEDKGPGFLARNSGSCQFCVNQHWQFPLGCPYGKPKEPPPPPGFLEKVANEILAKGKPSPGAMSGI